MMNEISQAATDPNVIMNGFPNRQPDPVADKLLKESVSPDLHNLQVEPWLEAPGRLSLANMQHNVGKMVIAGAH